MTMGRLPSGSVSLRLAEKPPAGAGPLQVRAFSATDLQFLNTLIGDSAYALDNARLLQEAGTAGSCPRRPMGSGRSGGHVIASDRHPAPSEAPQGAWTTRCGHRSGIEPPPASDSGDGGPWRRYP
jgi:hypothetical protein